MTDNMQIIKERLTSFGGTQKKVGSMPDKEVSLRYPKGRKSKYRELMIYSNDMLSMYKRGYLIGQIGKEFGVSYATIYKILKDMDEYKKLRVEHGLFFRTRSPEMRTSIVERYGEKIRCKKCNKVYGIDRFSFRKYKGTWHLNRPMCVHCTKERALKKREYYVQ